ncbi:MAG: BglII/BstYI family type II restriction endonuclease [Lamprobacter sp.]|uniref:BglII/BstYI family type II restriction endonuclease n=1 Tax=Lamprobacter sp. TaxID=3100796 RepID=UPI002B25FFC4|nr:BglII/BstYI family type II restriction endonuclease [Lamprobacter sp.]MEA3641520.1 BglII/BstYI family type II restriction endonuclease [Lamprobacter sp.]
MMLSSLVSRGFEVLALHHAEAILIHDMPEALAEIEEVLGEIEIPIEELVRGGGGESPLTQRMRRALAQCGWNKHNFEIKKIVDGEEKESISHEIDHVKRFLSGIFALEIEWNNKDPFFDRDLENFKRLHADGVISIGGIITRGTSLQNALRERVAGFARDHGIISTDNLSEYYSPTSRQLTNIERAVKTVGSFDEGWARAFVSDKFGEATTHWRKLEDRVRRGVGNPCPLLLIGIPESVLIG